MGTTTATLFAILLLAATAAQPPNGAKDFSINEHVRYEATQTLEGGLHIRFLFKDHTETLLEFEHTYDYRYTINMISRFGLPNSFSRDYYPAEEPNRLKIIDNALFKLKAGKIGPDLSAVATLYSDDFAKPIADFIIASLRQRGIDTRQHRIAMAMAFTQDIPYGVPEFEDGVNRAGLSPAPLILLSGFGDCDSKATLFVGILRHLIKPEDIIFLHEQGARHVLTAIRDIEAPGRWTITHDGDTFVLADTAGTARFAFGEWVPSKAGTSVTVEPYVNRTLPFHADADYTSYGYGQVTFGSVFAKVSLSGSTRQEQFQGGEEVPAALEDNDPFVAPDEPGDVDEEAGEEVEEPEEAAD